jgi:uncharacterized protein
MIHIIPGDPTIIFVVETSSIYSIAPELLEDSPDVLAEISSLSPCAGPPVLSVEPSPTAISLNIAQSCNLACSYCYADEGRFGGTARMMPGDVAFRALQRLFEEARSNTVTVGFIGGEPLLNRPVLHSCVEYASGLSKQFGIRVTFGITTNGTLFDETDIGLFRKYPFAVTVSLDGSRPLNDNQRPSKNGTSSFLATANGIAPLLKEPGRSRIAARATITRNNLDVAAHIAELAAVGFSEIGVSPLRTSATAGLALRDDDWSEFLLEMKRAASLEWERVRTGNSFRFSNLAIALKQLHRGSCKPLPCGAATNYVSVNAAGEYFACHRTIDDRRFRLGDLETGPSIEERRRFAASRHVDLQEPCNSCWARYLCGGGCHAEVLSAGRSGCDYIRGWLDFCIGLYPIVLRDRPDFFAAVEEKSVERKSLH